jgi:hypothetical protein
MISALAVLLAFYLLLKAARLNLRDNRKMRMKVGVPLSARVGPGGLLLGVVLVGVGLVASACGVFW